MTRPTARGIYAALLRCFPSAFREEYGPAMEQTFVERYRNARQAGRLAAYRLLAREAGSLISGGLAERVAARGAGTGLAATGGTVFAWQDIRYAIRLLTRTPVFTAMTILVLAGGLGISIFTFSFLRTAMLAPIPVDGGDRIVRLLVELPDGRPGSLDAGRLAALRPGVTSLTDVGVFTRRSLLMGAGDGGYSIDATATEASLFTATRARPLIGRTLQPADLRPGAEPVVVLGYRPWTIAFGRDSGVVGRLVEFNRTPMRVVGVMPEGFGFPVAAEAWVPVAPALLDPLAGAGNQIDAFGRLAEGLSADRAQAELSLLLARTASDTPARPGDPPQATRMLALTFPMAQMGGDGPAVLTVLNGLAALILLLACINVGNLLLARANERRREMAVRLALGASRPRLVMQHLWESVILCLAGGTLATLIAVAGLDLIDGWARSNLEGNLVFWWRWGFDRSVLLAAGLFVTVAIAGLGVAVSLRATSDRVIDTLRAGAAPTEGKADTRWSRILVVTQVVAVSVVMFVGAMSAILARRVLTIDFGHDTSRLVQTGFELPVERYPTGEAVSAARLALATSLSAKPDIAGVLMRRGLADIGTPEARVEIPGEPTDAALAPSAFVTAVDGPLTPLGIPLHSGRYLDAKDGRDGAPVAMISQALGQRLWPGAEPVGRQLRFPGLEGEAPRWRTVVGVVADVPFGNPLSRERSPIAAYLPLDQTDVRGVALLVKYRGTESVANAGILEALEETDPLFVASLPQSYREMIEKSSLIASATARTFGGCFVFALLLAVSGTYGLVARSIARRTREIGIRRALGATDGGVLRLLVWQGGRHLGLGALIALPFTVAGALAIASVLPIEPALAVGSAVLVSVAVALVVFAATWVPTRRAVRIEPRDALWREG